MTDTCSLCGHLLQWGLTLSSEETCKDFSASHRYKNASMGPHSFERGNYAVWASSTDPSTLQWGLTLSSEETAATRISWLVLPLLQWGLTLSSEETFYVFLRHLGQSVASMGPHSFERGNSGQTGVTSNYRLGFNGASLFRARKPIQ